MSAIAKSIQGGGLPRDSFCTPCCSTRLDRPRAPPNARRHEDRYRKTQPSRARCVTARGRATEDTVVRSPAGRRRSPRAERIGGFAWLHDRGTHRCPAGGSDRRGCAKTTETHEGGGKVPRSGKQAEYMVRSWSNAELAGHQDEAWPGRCGLPHPRIGPSDREEEQLDRPKIHFQARLRRSRRADRSIDGAGVRCMTGQ